jgi:hypothetical protein
MMGFKDNLIPLAATELLSLASRERLRQHHVTTVEELVGTIEADPQSVGEMLGFDGTEVDWLRTQATSLLDPETREALNAQRGKTYPLGALDPRTRREHS